MANEMRLIDAKALAEEIYQLHYYVHGIRSGKTLLIEYAEKFREDVLRAICKAPTVDAVPVVHGRWIHIVEDGEGGCYGFCSRCSTEHHAGSASALKAFHRYCRWCGADMRGDGNGNL